MASACKSDSVVRCHRIYSKEDAMYLCQNPFCCKQLAEDIPYCSDECRDSHYEQNAKLKNAANPFRKEYRDDWFFQNDTGDENDAQLRLPIPEPNSG